MKKTENKTKKASEKLETETKEMEAQLEQLKKMMVIEKQRREDLKNVDGGIWQSGDKSKQLKGYGQAVLDKHKKDLARAKKRILKNNAAGTLSKEEVIIKNVNKTLSQGGTRKDSAAKKEEVQTKLKIKEQPKVIESTEESQDTQDEFPEVIEFLESIKLIKYKDIFIQNGFEDIETILELNEEYLESLGMPLGHKLKIMKRIRELRPDDEDRPSTVSQTQAYSNEGVSCSTDDIKNNEEEKHEQADRMYKAPDSKLYSHNFGSFNNENNNQPDNCGFECNDSINIKTKKNMCTQETSTIEQSEYYPIQTTKQTSKFVEASVQYQPKEMAIDPMLDGCKVGAKASCWQCFKLEITTEMISDVQIPNKLFCGVGCLQKYMQDNPLLAGSRSPAKCGNESCSNTFLQIK